MKLILTFFAMMIVPFTAMAGEEDLYAPVPPADSAFVRVVNVTGDSALTLQIDGASLPAGAHSEVSDYIIIKQGERALSFGDKKQTITIEARQYYSLAITAKDTDAKIIKDALIENPAKAMVYFYNFSDAPAASLSVPSHNATVFEDIAPLGNSSRAINAATIDFTVKSGSNDVATLEKIALRRQVGTSIFLTGTAGNYKAFAIENKVSQ
jgi:alginate O-acetyltransferase complex protein AlgF